MKIHHSREFREFQLCSEQVKRRKIEGTTPAQPTLHQPTLGGYQALNKSFSKDNPKQAAITQSIAKMICCDLQPLDIVNNSGFRTVLETAEPRYVIPTRKSLTYTVIPGLYDEVHTKVTAKFKSDGVRGIAITTDAWTSRTNQSYISYTGHCIDDNFNLNEYCLRVVNFDDRHTAKNLADNILDIIKEYVPQPVCIPIYIVADNAANIKAAVKLLSNPFVHIPCFAHTLQLCINDSIKEYPDLLSVAGKAKEVTTHFRHSFHATSSLFAMQQQLGLSTFEA
jgi:hypothetical protein